jgi:hypothetical protein
MSVTIKKVAYRGWKNCCRISNGIVDLIVTLDVGPRIIRFGFVGGDNELKEFDEHLGKRGGKQWRSYGGHRLWHAPEGEVRSYFPDNEPVTLEKHGNVIRLIPPVETTNGVQKEIDIILAAKQPRVEVLHRLRNVGQWPIELAPWALSVMAPGGTAIIPLPKRGTHPELLLPESTLTIWPYTHLSDPRWTWGSQYILLKQDSSPAATPQKLGALVPDGWAAYARNGHLFLKTFPCLPGAKYVDFGCNFETFTDRAMLEVETLGPLTTLAPGQSVEHPEQWRLFDNVPTPATEADVKKHVAPKIKAALASQ